MAIKLETVVEYSKNPAKLLQWINSLTTAELIEVQHILLECANELHEAMEEWAESVGSEGINDAIDIFAKSMAQDTERLMNLQEEYENLYGIDCTEANDIINRVKKGVSK